ncbi:hypothetical protein [Nisaea denitrificans]|uniref:hypothetical protein n=1 Tax=Nisaea denitrificans TaxID=390877 RepID=UPI0004173A12|nr:hypothetical protein [Nisaea denitrificans]
MGGSDNDTISALAGNDLISGSTGNDILYGNQNEDTIYGGRGDDSLADSFVFHPGDGNNTVSDYSKAEGDVLQFDTGTEVTSAATETGLTLTAGDTTVTLIVVATIEDVSTLFA